MNEATSDRGEFVFAIILWMVGLLPLTGVLGGIINDPSLRESTGWLLFNVVLLMVSIKVQWIFTKYTFRVYRREFNGIQDIIGTIRSVWSEAMKEAK